MSDRDPYRSLLCSYVKQSVAFDPCWVEKTEAMRLLNINDVKTFFLLSREQGWRMELAVYSSGQLKIFYPREVVEAYLDEYGPFEGKWVG